MKHEYAQVSAWLLLVLLIGLLGDSVAAQTSVTVLVDSRASQQTARSLSDNLATPTIIDLAATGFAAGDVVEFENTAPAPGFSNFSCNGSFKPIGEENVTGTFSASDALLPQDSLDRVVDLITPPGLFIARLEGSLEIPVGATHLFLGIADTFWLDNCTPGNISAEFPNGAVVFTMTTTALTVAIDIKPGSFPNSINLSSGGATPVAILGSATFDVTLIDQTTLTLGTAGVKTVGRKDPHVLCSIQDVSGDFSAGPEGAPDGFNDLVCHFITIGIVPESGDTEAKLSGDFISGGSLEGTDSTNIVQ